MMICPGDELPPGDAKNSLTSTGRADRGLQYKGRVFGLLNACPHQGAALCEGPLIGSPHPTTGEIGIHQIGRNNPLVPARLGIRHPYGQSYCDPKTLSGLRAYPVNVEPGCRRGERAVCGGGTIAVCRESTKGWWICRPQSSKSQCEERSDEPIHPSVMPRIWIASLRSPMTVRVKPARDDADTQTRCRLAASLPVPRAGPVRFHPRVQCNVCTTAESRFAKPCRSPIDRDCRGEQARRGRRRRDGERMHGRLDTRPTLQRRRPSNR